MDIIDCELTQFGLLAVISLIAWGVYRYVSGRARAACSTFDVKTQKKAAGMRAVNLAPEESARRKQAMDEANSMLRTIKGEMDTLRKVNRRHEIAHVDHIAMFNEALRTSDDFIAQLNATLRSIQQAPTSADGES